MDLDEVVDIANRFMIEVLRSCGLVQCGTFHQFEQASSHCFYTEEPTYVRLMTFQIKTGLTAGFRSGYQFLSANPQPKLFHLRLTISDRFEPSFYLIHKIRFSQGGFETHPVICNFTMADPDFSMKLKDLLFNYDCGKEL